MGRVTAKHTSKGTIFIWKGEYEERHIPKGAGFLWDPYDKVWWTRKPDIAAKLRKYMDEAAVKALEEGPFTSQDQGPSLPEVSIVYPEGLSPFPYQVEGARFLLQKNGALLADEMGLGKTVQVLLAINSDPKINKVLVFCPASVKLNWVREASRWLVRPFEVRYLSGKTPEPIFLPKDRGLFVVINHDIADAWSGELSKIHWDMLVLDEAHYLKNRKAVRTRAILGEEKNIGLQSPIWAEKKIALTGTPIVNRPAEVWPVLAWIDRKAWGSFWTYAKRYCNLHHNGYGWDASGASNLEELSRKLSRYMLRRRKDEVLKDLPPKIRQVLELPPNGATNLIAKEKELWDRYSDELARAKAAVEIARAESEEELKEALSRLRALVRVYFQEMSLVRHQLALAKVPKALEHIQDVLESKDKVVVWVHHRDVAEAVFEGLREHNPVMVLGGSSAEARAEAVKRFQEDKDVRVFIGGITAAAEGITLTASDIAVFIELDWRPGKLLQAEDRIHRIGQTRNVIIHYLVFDGSLDAYMAKKLAEKMEIISRAVDGKTAGEEEEGTEDVVPLEDHVSITPKEVKEPEVKPSEESKAVILKALQVLSGYDTDRASYRNDMGFSKVDTYIGHELASRSHLTDRQALLGLKLVKKYRRQLEDLLSEAPEEVRKYVYSG
jgi:SWI/SNF-related matrix-associated actin-dependent regulator 1 of chromatin subfamily A